MYEGKIIKFYRQKAKLTQEQLGIGICSTTHVSKIERGLTEYSSEITDLLAEKLGINMEKEISNLTSVKEKLDLWHEMIVSQNIPAATSIHAELDNNPLITMSKYEILFYLIGMMHHIKLNNDEMAQKLLQLLPKTIEKQSVYEQNLYNHVMGIYYMMLADHVTSIRHLKSIDFQIYSNPLVYFDLASAYHHNKSPVLAYYYAEKALDLFKQRNNFLGIIDAENLMIIQLESNYHREFNETVEQYEKLLSLCDLVHAYDKKAKILHNYAYENFRKQNYTASKILYKKSMELKKKDSSVYLLSLEGFIHCCREGDLLTEQALLEHIEEGLSIARKINDTLYSTILKLHKYQILKQDKQYYDFLSGQALPYFKTNGYVMISQRYEKELFTYYIKNDQKEKALELSMLLMEYLDK